MVYRCTWVACMIYYTYLAHSSRLPVVTGTFLLSSPQITSFRLLLYSYVKLHSIATADMLIQYINVYGYTIPAILLLICTCTGAGVLFHKFRTNFEIWLYRYSFGSPSSPTCPIPTLFSLSETAKGLERYARNTGESSQNEALAFEP